jgi:hypothetical protein
MIDLIVRILSIALPASAFAILVSLAYWICQQKTSSPQAVYSKLNFAIYALLLSFTGFAGMIHYVSGVIQAAIYKVWAIKFFYFLAPIAVIFLINAINASEDKPPVNGSWEWPKRGQWKSKGVFFSQIFALITALMAFHPNAILQDLPSLWYCSMYIVFGVSTVILLVSSLRKVSSILEKKKVAYTVWGGASIIVAIQFFNMFIEQFWGISPLLVISLNSVVVLLGGAMIYVGFTEKTTFERFMLPISVVENVLDVKEGEMAVLTYTTAADKMKVLSAFTREGLESGDAVWYTCPDEETETVRAKLRKYGIDVEKYEKEGALRLDSVTEGFKSNGKIDFEKAVIVGLKWWAEKKSEGYKHARTIEDVGDFSLIDGQWQKYITDYWLNPAWDDVSSEWVESEEPTGVVYVPFIMDVTAINVERMTEIQINGLLKAFGKGKRASVKFLDLLEETGSFSKSIGLNHRELIGRKILLEFDPVSDYEKVIDSLAKENMANVEPLFVFTSSTSLIHYRLAHQPSTKFFLTSISTSTPKSTAENKVLLPAKNAPLILDALSKVLETYADANVCVVFDILSELLTIIGQEKTFIFLRHALDMLSSEKTTSLFLLNTSAHETEVVSRLRNFFSNQLAYDKNGLVIMKTS